MDGLILLQPISDIHELCEQLIEKDIRCVRVSQRPFQGMPWISLGDSEAAYEMTKHLIELGHERIGFIIGHPEHGQSHDRLEGYLRALKDHGIAKNPAWIEQGYFNFESGFEAAQKLFKTNPRPTAIFASNDPMALGVLSAAHQAGLNVPVDLSVAGYDDSPLARYTYPSLTTVKQPTEALAQSATQILMQQINGKEDIEHAKKLMAKLVRRDSTTHPKR